MDEQNEKTLPTISVTWDPEQQAVNMTFSVGEFKTWEFVEAVLRMGADKAKLQGAIARVVAQQQAQQQAIQGAALRSKLHL